MVFDNSRDGETPVLMDSSDWEVQMSDVTDMIAAYRRGELTLDELAQRFRDRSWPSRRLSPPTLEEAYRRELQDPEPIADGSFDEVASAHLQGEISSQEYDILARAAGEARPSKE